MDLVPQQFVVHRELGIGRRPGGRGHVRFFDSPAADEIVLSVEEADIRSAPLEPQQRVWWHNGSQWLVGRVDSLAPTEGEAYFIHFPKSRTEPIPASDIRVRWAKPLADPVALLAYRAVETRFFHKRRSHFLRAVMAERAACEGLGGILSSGVELHEHQVGAARRVLLDPVRRYLLADEVGLGKTIEAGMVLRQLLIDGPGQVLVLVPGSLIGQWRDQLNSKFRIGQFRDRVRVVGHEDLDGIPPSPRLLVVVDEAHRLAELGGQEHRYRHLATITDAASALLLLSATPVRSNEDAFLRLLHLLDPLTYRLEDLTTFRHKVAIRDDLANAMSSLDEETPVTYLTEPVVELRRLLPDDEGLRQLLDGLDSAISEGSTDGARSASRQIRIHLSETYRIHRRLIRNRRTGSLLRTFPVRGRTKATEWLLLDPDPRRRQLLDVLEGLRVDLAGRPDLEGSEIFRTVFGRALAPIEALAGLAFALRGDDRHTLSDRDMSRLARYSGSPDALALANAFEELSAQSVTEDRISRAVAWARQHVDKRRVAIACSYPEVARKTADRLAVALGEHRLCRLLQEMSESDQHFEVARFVADPARTVIVLDNIGEEGINLQIVDEVLHLDLPMTVSQLEQRLGRFDRWIDRRDRTRGPVRSVLFVDSDPVVEDQLGAWRQGLDKGVEIFDRSSATLQYVLPELEDSFFDDALDRGLAEAGVRLEHAQEYLARQRRRIQGQDMLDAIDDRAEDVRYLESLVAIDKQSDVAARSFRRYAGEALGFTVNKEPGGVRYGVSKWRPPQLTESQIMSLGPHDLAVPYASDRNELHPGSGFWRWGEPLVDRFTDLVSQDDRGRAFAVELHEHGLEPDASPIPVFCFDLLVTADMSRIEAASADDALVRSAARRVLRFLAPTFQRVWLIPGRGEPPSRVIDRLEQSDGISLSSNPDRFAELVAGLPWATLCQEASNHARRIVGARADVRERLDHARARSAASREREEAIIRSRARADSTELRVTPVFDLVDVAITNPLIQVDACGVIVITPAT